jgi:hypothetical protein
MSEPHSAVSISGDPASALSKVVWTLDVGKSDSEPLLKECSGLAVGGVRGPGVDLHGGLHGPMPYPSGHDYWRTRML